MAIIKQYHADTDTTYVYESTSYWDAEKGQSRSKRRVIGKLDPVTGEVIPTGKRGRKKKELKEELSSPAADVHADNEKRILELQMKISELNARIAELESDIRKYSAIIQKVHSLSGRIGSLCGDLPET
ncbi:MAG: hypothetical protein IKG34_00025 [Solobacterium sp.]|nr:hypothetical protein [Solobacterium sp.]